MPSPPQIIVHSKWSEESLSPVLGNISAQLLKTIKDSTKLTPWTRLKQKRGDFFLPLRVKINALYTLIFAAIYSFRLWVLGFGRYSAEYPKRRLNPTYKLEDLEVPGTCWFPSYRKQKQVDVWCIKFRKTWHSSFHHWKSGPDMNGGYEWIPSFFLGGGFKYFLFSSLFGEDSHFD